MKPSTYLVIQDHLSEFPEPLSLEKGALITLDSPYDGPEGWDNWIFCESPGQKGGWVPVQILEIITDSTARVRETYTARELNVQSGELLRGGRTLNGWVWCEKPDSAQTGWVPLVNLKEQYP